MPMKRNRSDKPKNMNELLKRKGANFNPVPQYPGKRKTSTKPNQYIVRG